MGINTWTPQGNGEPLPYTYNLQRGGMRWRNSACRIRDIQPAGSVSQYGVDILWCGDSTTTYGDIVESVPHFVKVILQEALNRPGVTGGFGYFPLNTQNSTSNDWALLNTYTVTCSAANATVGATYTNGVKVFYVTATIAGATTLVLNGTQAPLASGTFTKTSGTGDASITYSSFVTTNSWALVHNDTNPGTGLLTCQINPQSAGAKAGRYFDPTTPQGLFQRQGLTSWEYVGIGGFGAPNYNTIFMDSAARVNAPIFPPANSVSNADGAYGVHWARQTGLSPTTPYYLQLGSTSTDKINGNGVILYNGDENEGVRVHALSSVGSDTGSWHNSGGANHRQANFDQFCTGANGGARNCKLAIFPLMLNDCGQTVPNVSPATYAANLQSDITYITGLPSKPCVCLMTIQPWDLTTSNPTQLALFAQYTQAQYALAAANPDTVFVIDLWKTLCDTPNTYQFVMTGITTAPAAGAVYKDPAGNSFTCVGSNSGKTGTAMTGATAPSASPLTKQSGTGDTSVAYTSFIPPSAYGYANYGIQAAGGAVNDSMSGYNDGTHLLGSGNHIRARQVASALLWGMGSGGSGNYSPNTNSITGVGTAYSLTNALAVVTFGTTSPTFSLPAGTWLVIGTVKFTGATAADDLQAQLYDNTGLAAIGDTHDNNAGVTTNVEIALMEIFTISATSNITIRAQNATSARGTVVAAGTYLRAVKIA